MISLRRVDGHLYDEKCNFEIYIFLGSWGDVLSEKKKKKKKKNKKNKEAGAALI